MAPAFATTGSKVNHSHFYLFISLFCMCDENRVYRRLSINRLKANQKKSKFCGFPLIYNRRKLRNAHNLSRLEWQFESVWRGGMTPLGKDGNLCRSFHLFGACITHTHTHTHGVTWTKATHLRWFVPASRQIYQKSDGVWAPNWNVAPPAEPLGGGS